MKADEWQRTNDLFHASLEREPGARAAFLAQACAGDEGLRREVESLLASHDPSDKFIESLAPGLAAGLLAESQARLVVGQSVGHYKVVALLGAGGMGEVYLAQDTRLHRRVALKLLPASFSQDQDQVSRFQREAHVVSALNHPNIITIYEIGETEGLRFIVTEFVDGETLRDVIARGDYDLHRVVKTILQVAEALVAAYRAGIVHRDIKPENIMVRRDGYVKVLDFGLAKATEERKQTDGLAPPQISYRVSTTPGLVMGTVNYMSPEQARGHSVDSRTDIFSLGVVLYEAATGHMPFEGETRNDVLIAIAGQDPPPLTEYLSEAPIELQQILDKALRKKPEDRYQTIAEMRRDLEQLKETLSTGTTRGQPSPTTDPIPARTTSGANYLVSEIIRHRATASFAFVGLLLIVPLIIGAYKFFAPGPTKTPLSLANLSFSKITTTGKEFALAISPDGKYVIYNIPPREEGLMIRQVLSGSTAQLLPTRSACCTFTPDSNYVYCRIIPGNPKNSFIQRIPVLPGQAQRIVEDVLSGVSFSPDGKRMTFVRHDETGQEWLVMIADSDGGNEQVLVRRSEREGRLDGEMPAWSPDGKLIAVYGRIRENNISHYSVVGFSADTGAEIKLTSQRWRGILGIAWLPDSSAFLLSGVDRTGGIEGIWLVSYPGGEARRLTNELSCFRGVTLTADGSKILTSLIGTPAAIWVVPDGDSNRANKVTHINGFYYNLVWTPDGRIVHTLDDDLWIMNADGSGQRQLTLGQGRNVQPTVTSDGRYIVFSSSRAGNYNIWRLELMSGELKQLTNGSGETRPLCTSDGQWVLYSCRIPSRGTVCKVPLAGGEPVQVGEILESATAAALSPDNKLFAYQFRDQANKFFIAIRPVEGGPVQKVLEWRGNPDNPDLNWSPDGRNFLYAQAKDIWLQPLDGSPPKQLTNFGAERVISFALSRDGKNLAVTRGDITSDVVLISVK